jgi:hypothetical protein
LDGKELSKSRRALFTACGRCENTDMRFSADRRTVGRNWGRAPTLIEAATGPLYPPGKAEDARDWRCFALGPDGRAKDEVPLRTRGQSDPHFRIGPEYRTMWYLLTRERAGD